MSTLTLPFEHLNLVRNPFGEATPDERAALAVVDLTPWVAHLSRPRRALLFVGDHGRGKSTRLLALAARLEGARYLRAARGEAARWPEAQAVLLDEAELVPRRHLARLLSRGVPVALAAHRDLSDVLVRARYEVLVDRVVGLSVGLLDEICRRRIEAARRRPGPLPRVSPSTLRALCARHADDVRAIELELYESFQTLGGTADVVV